MDEDIMLEFYSHYSEKKNQKYLRETDFKYILLFSKHNCKSQGLNETVEDSFNMKTKIVDWNTECEKYEEEKKKGKSFLCLNFRKKNIFRKTFLI